MIVIRVLLCILMLTEVSAVFADAPDFITISELNKARKKKSFADVDNLLNRKGWLSMSPEKLADNNVSVLEWTYGIDYRMSFERSWKRLCNVVITTTMFNANRFINKNLSKYRLVLQTRTKTFYRDGNEMVMLKTSDKSHFVTLTFATKDDDYWRMMNGKFCSEAWDCISRYIYSGLQGGSIMKDWTNDNNMMIACCNDGTRPVIFKIERIE